MENVFNEHTFYAEWQQVSKIVLRLAAGKNIPLACHEVGAIKANDPALRQQVSKQKPSYIKTSSGLTWL